jgi:hypothetical protein
LKEDHFSAERKLLDPWHSSITCKAVQQDWGYSRRMGCNPSPLWTHVCITMIHATPVSRHKCGLQVHTAILWYGCEGCSGNCTKKTLGGRAQLGSRQEESSLKVRTVRAQRGQLLSKVLGSSKAGLAVSTSQGKLEMQKSWAPRQTS